MPNQRAEGQKLLTVPASENFIKTIDENLAGIGYANRSQFIRDAIREKIERAGVSLPKEIALAPDRAGKGGPKKSNSTTTALVKSPHAIRIAHKLAGRRAAAVSSKPSA